MMRHEFSARISSSARASPGRSRASLVRERFIGRVPTTVRTPHTLVILEIARGNFFRKKDPQKNPLWQSQSCRDLDSNISPNLRDVLTRVDWPRALCLGETRMRDTPRRERSKNERTCWDNRDGFARALVPLARRDASPFQNAGTQPRRSARSGSRVFVYHGRGLCLTVPRGSCYVGRPRSSWTLSAGHLCENARASEANMVSVMQPYMDIESSRSYIDELYSPDPQKCLEAIICLKNSVIGSNRQKGSVIAQGVVPRLLQLLGDSSGTIGDRIRLESAVTLGSLAKGTDQHVLALIDLGVVPLLLQVLLTAPTPEAPADGKMRVLDLLNEACLRCLRTVFQHATAPILSIFQDPALVPRLLSLTSRSVTCQICVATILTTACKTTDEQNALSKGGAVETLAMQLDSPLPDVQLPALACLANMCYQNHAVSVMVASASTSSAMNGRLVPVALGQLMGRERSSLIQLEAARCIAYMHRAGALPSTDPRVVYRALPCLVRLCHRDRPPRERVAAAETLAYLTEVDTDLQRLASISNHLIPTLAELLRPHPQVQDATLTQDMRQAAFRAFASLGANDEDIRKRIIETESLMEQVVSGLQDPGGSRVRLAAVRCLHSLSRSVQQLRTTFQDHAVWRPLMQLLHGADKGLEGRGESEDDLLTVASSTLCNLLLEFSPSKEPILESGGVELLCSLTKRPDPALRLNGIWALMNVAFQAEQRVKSQILSCLGTDQIFRLLADPELAVLMKTLGLLRNLLSTKAHIDRIMGEHAAHVMQAVILVLEDPEHPADVKEQALCILANVADGDRARDHIMANDDVLKKLMDYMMHSNVKLQVAAIFCVCNLVWREEPGAAQRQARLRELGIYRILQQLRQTKDTQLFEKVKTAIAQFYDA